MKYYTGYTTHLWTRIEEHNQGKTTFTRTGIPWSLTYAIQCDNISTAKDLEIAIKRRGAERYLDSLREDLKLSYN